MENPKEFVILTMYLAKRRKVKKEIPMTMVGQFHCRTWKKEMMRKKKGNGKGPVCLSYSFTYTIRCCLNYRGHNRDNIRLRCELVYSEQTFELLERYGYGSSGHEPDNGGVG